MVESAAASNPPQPPPTAQVRPPTPPRESSRNELNLGKGKGSKPGVLGDLTRFFMKLGDFTPDLLIHAIADTRGKGNENDERNAAFIRFIKNLIHRYFVRFKPRSKAPPLITGADLIHHFGLTPSPLFKTILNRVEERTLSNGLRDRTAALIFVEELLGRRIKA